MTNIPIVVDAEISASVTDYIKLGVEIDVEALGKCCQYTFDVF